MQSIILASHICINVVVVVCMLSHGAIRGQCLACVGEGMTVLLKNLFTVHILIWQTQIRNQHYLWWRIKARSDTARRSITIAFSNCIVAKSSVENSFPFNAWVCTLNRSPPTNKQPPTPTQPSHCGSCIMFLLGYTNAAHCLISHTTPLLPIILTA